MPCIYSLNSSKGRLFIPLRKETLLGGFPRCALLLSPHLPPPWNVCATPVLLLGHVSWCAQIQVCHRVRPLTPFPSSSAPSTRAEPESPGTCSCYLEHPYTVTHVLISRLPCALNFAPLILLIFPVESSKGLDLEDHRDTGGEGRGPAPGKATGKAGLDLVTHAPSSLSSGCRVDRTSACLLQYQWSTTAPALWGCGRLGEGLPSTQEAQVPSPTPRRIKAQEAEAGGLLFSAVQRSWTSRAVLNLVL